MLAVVTSGWFSKAQLVWSIRPDLFSVFWIAFSINSLFMGTIQVEVWNAPSQGIYCMYDLAGCNIEAVDVGEMYVYLKYTQISYCKIQSTFSKFPAVEMFVQTDADFSRIDQRVKDKA